MEANFDLDINNYATDDLLNFFKLDNNFTINDLENREKDIINEISNDKSSYTTKYKNDIIDFIKSAKIILISLSHDFETNKEIVKNINKNITSYMNKGKDDTVGRIINPLSTHPALQQTVNPPHNINGYAYNTTTCVYVFNTAARNDFLLSEPSDCVFDLPMPWTNVIQLTLTAAIIPNVTYTFSADLGTNQIFIEEDGTGLSGIVTLPQGNYVPYQYYGMVSSFTIENASFPDTLTTYINSTLGSGNRFLVSFDPASFVITISNTTNTFSMNTLFKDPQILCNPYYTAFNDNNLYFNIDDKSKLTRKQYLGTMAYIAGYREIMYFGKQSYTGESVFRSYFDDYLYFSVDDYTGSQTSSNTYGVLADGMLADNILGIIPLTAKLNGAYGVTYDTNANFIYKKREYFGPVNISKIRVKVLNQLGNLLNFRKADYTFALEVKTIYNLHKSTVPNLRNSSVQ